MAKIKKQDGVSVTRYETECFYVDIIETVSEFEAWLTEKHCGVSDLMFGCPKEQSHGTLSLEHFLHMVEENLDDYIYEYYADHDNGWRD